MEQLLSQAAYARHLAARYGYKCSRQNIHKLVGNVIPPRHDKKISVIEADAAMAARGLIELGPLQAALPSLVPLPADNDDAEDERAAPAGSSRATYYAQKAEREAIETQLKQLQLDQLQGTLVKQADVGEAQAQAGGKIVEAVNLVPAWTDELTAAALKEGATGVRVLLRQKANDLRDKIAKALMAGAELDDANEQGNSA